MGGWDSAQCGDRDPLGRVEENLIAPAWAHAFVAKLTAPKQELWLTSKGQIDFYDDPRLINESSDAIAAHFIKDSA